MDEAGIRALLRARVEWGIAPGKRVVTRDAVEKAGHDVDAVDRFIVARGGERVDPERREHPEPSAQPYWLVPSELLAR